MPSNGDLIRTLRDLSRLYAEKTMSWTTDEEVKLDEDFKKPLTDMLKYFGNSDIKT